MRLFVERLRERPKHDRLMIAAGSAISVMSVLLFGWGVAVLYSFDGTPAETQAAAPVVSESRNTASTQVHDEARERIQIEAVASSSVATSSEESEGVAEEVIEE